MMQWTVFLHSNSNLRHNSLPSFHLLVLLIAGASQWFETSSYPVVMSVGSIDESGYVSGFSPNNPRVEIVAPGENILSTWSGAWFDGTAPDNQYASLSGTSMVSLLIFCFNNFMFKNLSNSKIPFLECNCN